MAEITRERQGEIQKWVLKFLIDAGETLPARTTITLVKAGWLNKSKGRWAITDEGKKAYEDFADPVKLSLEASRLYREWKANQPDKEEEDEEDTPTAVSALEEAEESAWTEIQEYLGNMPPYEFQDLVAALLKAMGYYVSWVAPPGKDAGIDILAHNDPLGTNPPRIKVQVKRKADKVAVDGLRSFLAVLGDEDVGIFVSLGGITSDAESEARTQEKRRVTLLDMEKLFDLWVEHYDDVEETEKRLLPLRPIYFLEPNI
jgi:restriction system protein